MSRLESIAWTAVKIKTDYGRGQSWVNMFKDIATIFLATYVLEDLLQNWNIPDSWFNALYIILPTAYLFGCILSGHLDRIYGIWKKEAHYTTKELNPFFEELDKKIDEIREEIKEVKRRLK